MTTTFWDKQAQTYDEDIQQHGALYQKTIERTNALLTASDVVLDFGCASGEMSLDIAPHVQQLYGIDVSAKMIELARQKVAQRPVDNLTFEQMNLFDSKLAEASFTAVVAFNILHLVEETAQALTRVNGLLADAGWLISQTPCLGERGWLINGSISLAGKLGLVPNVHRFTIPQLESLVASSGFEIVETMMWDAKNQVQWIVARKIGRNRDESNCL